MERTFSLIGSLSAFIAVAAGAFGAHSLRGSLSPEMLAIFETAVRYQMIHALALLVAAWQSANGPAWLVRAAGWLFVAGTVFFSGSLYALSLTGARAWGAVTPLGGLGFLAGWLCLGMAAWRRRH